MDTLRIVRRLAALYPAETASRLKRAVIEGQVTVAGVVVDDPGALVPEKAAVFFDPNRKIRRKVDTSLTILYQDDDSVAVVKPAGLLTHPTEAKEKDTLLSRVSTWAARVGKGRAYVGIVHRLDKETSGALVFARTRKGLVSLQAQLRAHTVDRRYVALVEGNLEGDKGTFEWPILEEGERRKRVAREGETGIKAITDWKVLERLGIATLVEARLRTGRTHQIRIHFSHAGHTLVGDQVYRDPKKPPFPIPFKRQALHAGHLGWEKPDGGKVSVTTPPPKDFEELLAALRKRKEKGRTPGKPGTPGPSKKR
ncbi:MAG TPA: RluA family pseudouridine synthase [Thermoanaerobaculia bacterium]|nr:RluA family pseudouridine synthase [Thermoanaerobaculia bacterium]